MVETPPWYGCADPCVFACMDWMFPGGWQQTSSNNPHPLKPQNNNTTGEKQMSDPVVSEALASEDSMYGNFDIILDHFSRGFTVTVWGLQPQKTAHAP